MQDLRKLLEDMDDEEFDKRIAREKHIEKLIRYAFERCGLRIDDFKAHAVNYDDDTREAYVDLDDIEADLGALAKLLKSGLADKYSVVATNDGIDIRFVVNPELDNAQI